MTTPDQDTRSSHAALRAFFRQREVKTPLARLQRRLPAEARIYVAGGALRNVIIRALHGQAPPTRDIDLFIGGLSGGERIDRVLAGDPIQRTDLGGIRWHPKASPFAWDICLLPDFVIIKQYGLAPSMESLLENLDFDVNAVLFDPVRGSIRERGCIHSIRRRILDFNTHRVADKRLLLYRVLLIRHKTGFLLSRPVFSFVKNAVDLDTLIQVRGLVAAKQGRSAGKRILKDYNAIATCPDHETYLAKNARPGLPAGRLRRPRNGV